MSTVASKAVPTNWKRREQSGLWCYLRQHLLSGKRSFRHTRRVEKKKKKTEQKNNKESQTAKHTNLSPDRAIMMHAVHTLSESNHDDPHLDFHLETTSGGFEVTGCSQGDVAAAPISSETPSTSFFVSARSCSGSVRSVGWRFLAKSSTFAEGKNKHFLLQRGGSNKVG